MALSHPGLIFALLLFSLATNLKETETTDQNDKITEETTGQDGGLSFEVSDRGKREVQDDGTGNTTATPSQIERGTEETKEDDGNTKVDIDSEQPTEVSVEETSLNKTSLNETRNYNATLSDSKNEKEETKVNEDKTKTDEDSGNEEPTESTGERLSQSENDERGNKSVITSHQGNKTLESKASKEDDDGEKQVGSGEDDKKNIDDDKDKKNKDKEDKDEEKDKGKVKEDKDKDKDKKDKDEDKDKEDKDEDKNEDDEDEDKHEEDEDKNKDKKNKDKDKDKEDTDEDKDKEDKDEDKDKEDKDEDKEKEDKDEEDKDEEDKDEDKDEEDEDKEDKDEDKEEEEEDKEDDDKEDKDKEDDDKEDDDKEDKGKEDKDKEDKDKEDKDKEDKDKEDKDKEDKDKENDDKEDDDKEDKGKEDKGKEDKDEDKDEEDGDEDKDEDKDTKDKDGGDDDDTDRQPTEEGPTDDGGRNQPTKEVPTGGGDTQPTEERPTDDGDIQPTERPTDDGHTQPTDDGHAQPTERPADDDLQTDEGATDYMMNNKDNNTNKEHITDQEKAKENLRERAENIDAKNRTHIQNVLASFKDILSDDKSDTSESKKLKDDLLAIKLIENVGKTIASQLKPKQWKPASVGEISGEQVFGVVAMHGINKSEFSFPDMIEGFRNVSSFPARVQLPSVVLNNNTGGNLSLVFMIYTPSSEMKLQTGNESFSVSGKVVLASIFPKPKFPFQNPVVITIRNKHMNSSKATLKQVCVFLMENSSNQNTTRFGVWTNKGCELAYSNTTHSICHCYHLTNFAILTRFSAKKIPRKHELPLSIITYIGLSLSIFGCLATLVVHLMLPKLWSDRAFIHMNLVTALGIANIVFLFQKLPDVGSAGCTTLTLVLLYFYLVAFCWMMLEGIHIYRMLVKVFESGRDPRKSYFVAGWGLPMLLVIITVAIFRDDVTSEYYCWLSSTNGALWVFAGPVCLVILVNTVMLLVVMKTSFHHSKHEKQIKRSMAKTFCVLLPVLGLTWFIGIITFNKEIIEMQYIFAILNSLQGFFIFLFYVIYSQEVRREIAHKISIWKTEKEINDKAQITRESKLRYSEQTNSIPPIKAWM